jgi:glycosyltransferase AglD
VSSCPPPPPPPPALAFALLYHLVHLVPVSIVGGAVLWREARREEPAGRDAPAGP